MDDTEDRRGDDADGPSDTDGDADRSGRSAGGNGEGEYGAESEAGNETMDDETGVADQTDTTDQTETADQTGDERGGDTFGVGIHVTDAEFQFVVHVPADIDSGWTDPEAFQRLVERTVWDCLDQEATLRGIERETTVGDTVTLGRVTLRPDGTVVETDFHDPAVES